MAAPPAPTVSMTTSKNQLDGAFIIEGIELNAAKIDARRMGRRRRRACQVVKDKVIRH